MWSALTCPRNTNSGPTPNPLPHQPDNLRHFLPKKCKRTCPFPPLLLNNSTISSVMSSNFWGLQTHRTSSLPLIRRISKEQLAVFDLLQAILVQFYTSTIKNILISAITIWFGAASSQEIRKLQRAVKMAKNIIGCDLRSLHDLCVSGTRKANRKNHCWHLSPCKQLAPKTDVRKVFQITDYKNSMTTE